MSIKISVIVPVYNVEKYVYRCLESVRNQTYRNIEVLVIDDGSTDSSGKICDEFGKVDDRFLIFHKPNGGLSNARNYGIDRVTGDYIFFLDSDDWIDSDLFEKIINNVTEFESDIIVFNFKSHYDSYIDLNKDDFKNIDIEIFKQHIWSGHFPPSIWRACFKKDLWSIIRFDERRCYEDILAWPEILSFSPLSMSFIEDSFYNYEKRNVNSIMSQNSLNHYYYNFLGNLSKVRNNHKVFSTKDAKSQYKVAYRLMMFNGLKAYLIHLTNNNLREDELNLLNDSLMYYKKDSVLLSGKYRWLMFLYSNLNFLLRIYSKKYKRINNNL